MAKEKLIKNLSDLESCIEVYKKPDSPLWFRGQGKRTWSLSPSLWRPPFNAQHEAYFIKKFRQDAYRAVAEKLPTDHWQWTFLMQHHGMPTRLLDWSENPLVALYFAVENEDHDTSDAAFWILRPDIMNSKSGLSYSNALELPSFEEDGIVADYTYLNGSSAAGAIRSPIAAIASRQFARIKAQYGTFTVYHPKWKVPIDKIPDQDFAFKFVVPKACRKKIRASLSNFGFDAFTIYPGLTELSGKIKAQVT